MTYIERFKNYLLHERRYSEHTILAYDKDLNQFYEMLGVNDDEEVKGLTHKLIRSYLVAMVDLGLENTTINRKLSSVKTFFKFLRQQQEISVNPASKIQSLKKKKQLPQFVPEKQLWTSDIFEDEKTIYDQVLIELIMELFYQTGIRLSELINLEESKVSYKQIKVLGKRNKERIVPIANGLVLLIEKFKKLKAENGVESKYLLVLNSQKNSRQNLFIVKLITTLERLRIWVKEVRMC